MDAPNYVGGILGLVPVCVKYGEVTMWVVYFVGLLATY